MRKWLEDNCVVVGIVAIVTIIAGAWFTFRPWGGAAQVAVPAFFFDLGTNKLFVADDQVPPIVAPSGYKQASNAPGGVRAHVFACGDCDAPNGQFVGVLETYSLKGKSIVESGQGDPPSVLKQSLSAALESKLIASPGAPGEWFAEDSQEASRVIHEVRVRCDKVRAQAIECGPGPNAPK